MEVYNEKKKNILFGLTSESVKKWVTLEIS